MQAAARFCFLLSLLFFSIQLHSQTDSIRKDYALLWEITGNGLTEASYLFGSMHIRQDFAFEFPDSLLHYIANCDAFANEVHLDSAMLRVFEVYIGGDELMTDSSYLAFIKTKTVQKDSNLSNNNIFTDNLEEENLQEFDLAANQATMLDASLMNTARGLGKKLYGLEKIDNHLYNSDEDTTGLISGITAFSTSHEELRKQYYRGDLAGIQKIIQKEAASFDKLELIPRNYIMVQRMKQIMPKESLFSVIGAAHLPGQEGVIELLRSEGFHLRRVLPLFDSAASTIEQSLFAKDEERSWTQIEDRGARFQLSTPLPYLFKNALPFETTYLQADIGAGLFYLLLTLSMTPDDYDNFDEYFFKNDGYEIINKSPFSVNGLEGYRYKLKKNNESISHFMGYVFIKNGELYYLQIGAYEAETFNNSTAPKVFAAQFFIEKSYPQKWSLVTDQTGGFSVQLPRHYITRNNDEDQSREYRARSYSAGFDNTQSSVWLTYYDTPIYLQRESDSLAFLLEIEKIEKHLGVELKISSRTKNKWTFTAAYDEKKLLVKGFVQSSGNRIYSLFSIDKKWFPNTKKFLKSFQLTPFITDELQKPVYLFDSLFQCYLPDEIKSEEFDYNQQSLHAPTLWQRKITSMDINTGAQYEVLIKKYHPLFGTSDTLSFLQENITKSTEEIKYLTPLYPQAERPQLYSKHPHPGKLYEEKRQLYVMGDYVLTKTVYADSAYFLSPICQQFFEKDIWEVNPETKPDLLTTKGDTLIALLAKQDSSYWPTLNDAIDARYSFESRHLDALRDILVQTAWSTSKLSLSLREKLFSALMLNDDDRLLDNLIFVFKSSPDDSPLRIAVLMTLLEETGSNEQLAHNTFFDLLMGDELLWHSAPEFIFKPFYTDSTLFIKNIDNVKRLLDSEKDHAVFWELATMVFNKNEAGKQLVRSIVNSFIKRGESRLNSYDMLMQRGYLSQVASPTPPPYYVLDLYQLFPENESIQLSIQHLLAHNYIDPLNVAAARFMISNGKHISSHKRKQLLKNQKTWLPMIRLLNEYQLLDDIRRKYYDREEIASAILAERLKADQLLATDIKVTDTVYVPFRGKRRLFYIFTFSLSDRSSGMGVVGQFSADKKERHFIDVNNVNYTDYKVTKNRRIRKAKALINELKR